jgi:hypothetical protein
VGASQFDNRAFQLADGRTRVSGPQRFEFPVEVVEYRFLLIQGDVVVKGFGTGRDRTWTGTTDPDQERLQEGPALGVGLAIVADTGNSPGFSTFSWSEQLQVVNG